MAGPLTPLSTAEILAVGSELLTPHRLDTNSLHLAGRLNDLGLVVVSKSVVADRVETLESALRLALSRSDVVVTSGGLGPTDDDVTREAVARVAGAEQREDSRLVEIIAERFARRGLTMPSNNRRQALVPAGGEALDNPNGTAPGLWMPIGDKVIISLPGPPRELKPMWQAQVESRLAARTGLRRVRRRVIKIVGRGESHVDEIAAPIYRPWATASPAIETSILASPGQVELHLAAVGEDVADLDRVLEAAVGTLSAAIGSPVFSVDGRELEVVVGEQLRDAGATVALAESCTGGLLAGRLTSVPGSSQWVVGGVVAYANVVKVAQLGVPAAMIKAHGAVSESVGAAMAAGVRERLGTTWGVGITGIAGPDGGTEAKPVGTVVIAVDGPGGARIRTLRLPGDRATVRRLAVQSAMDLLRKASAGPDYN